MKSMRSEQCDTVQETLDTNSFFLSFNELVILLSSTLAMDGEDGVYHY